MNRSAPPNAAPAPPLFPALALTLALACASLAHCSPALAAGSLPWLAPGQQDNASAAEPHPSGSNASTSNAAAALPPDSRPAAAPNAALPSATVPGDAAGQAQFEVLRQYFRRLLTLDEDFPEVFSRRVKDGEATAFLAMRRMQSKRGLLGRFRAAEVDLSGLMFTRVTNDPDLARIRVTGSYSFVLGPKALAAEGPKVQAMGGPKAQETPEARVHETLEEDALFVLLPEMGEWKIYERREAWQP
jgi:hypothetical protein